MTCKDVSTQEELDAALAAAECPHLKGTGYFVVTGSAQVTAYGSAQVRATAWVVTTVHGKRAKAIGGHVVALPEIKTVADWIEFYGVETEGVDGERVAYVFKAVNDEWKSGHDTAYKPGSTPEASDWDGGKDRCGGGLHFSPRPFMALSYNPDATKFVRCPVLVSELAVITDGADKVKGKRVVAPGCQEVDIDGNLLCDNDRSEP